MYIIPEILFLLGRHGQCQSYLRSYFSSGGLWSMSIIPEILFLIGSHGQCISYRRSYFSSGVMVNVYHTGDPISPWGSWSMYIIADPISPRGSWSMYIIPEILFLLGGHGQCISYLRSYFSSGVMVNVNHT